jgi:hypothetical protein
LQAHLVHAKIAEVLAVWEAAFVESESAGDRVHVDLG